jgi:hypothetical protein
MSLIKYLATINYPILGRMDDSKANAIMDINPQRIYLENVRSLFNVPMGIAKLICRMAVKDGKFVKKIGVQCPVCNRIIKSYSSEGEMENIIVCENCELKGDEKYQFRKEELKIIEFYQLV